MTKHNVPPAQGLTLAAEIDALGLGGFAIMHQAESIGQVSGRELLTFRDAMTARMRQQREGGPEEEFEPSPNLDALAQERLRKAHMVGSTVADILLSEEASRKSGDLR